MNRSLQRISTIAVLLAMIGVKAPAISVKSIEPLALSGMTIRDWSSVAGKLLGDQYQNVGGKDISQVYLRNLDGSQLENLTNPPSAGGPPAACHKGFAHFHPSGQAIVMTVESTEGGHVCGSSNSDPGIAAWTDLWLLNLQTRQWTNLTQYTGFPIFPYGALSPYFSHDGTRLMWSRLKVVASTPPAANKTFGEWELHVANFTMTPAPAISNDQILFGNQFFEPHGFSPDDKRILFASDLGLAFSGGLDLFEYDSVGNAVRNLSNTSTEYDEHARYSPDGKQIVFGSGQWVGNTGPGGPFQSEVTLINADGSGKQQVTHSNTAGTTEACTDCGSWPNTWSPDGKQMIFAQQLFPLTRGVKSWLITLDDRSGSITPEPPDTGKGADATVNDLPVRVFPNPWRADGHSDIGMTFENLSPDSTVQIFDLAGRVVRSFTATSNTAIWNRKNNSDDDVASGLYVYVVTDRGGNHSRGKLTIIR